jgi:hypothetical protein
MVLGRESDDSKRLNTAYITTGDMKIVLALTSTREYRSRFRVAILIRVPVLQSKHVISG